MKTERNNSEEISFKTSPVVTNHELNSLFATAWDDFQPRDFKPILEKSLTYVGAYRSGKLIGFVNLAWDGGVHAFILDTTVDPKHQKQGIGRELVEQTFELAKSNGIEWIHVDFAPHLQGFYDKCGFTNTCAGLKNLNTPL